MKNAETAKNNYAEEYKSIYLVELKPNKLVGVDEYNDLFFERIDEIDNLINIGESLSTINDKFNLELPKTFIINQVGDDLKSKRINEISKDAIKNVFSISIRQTEYTC